MANHGYTQIVTALELDEHQPEVAEHSVLMAARFRANISLIHVVPPIPVATVAPAPEAIPPVEQISELEAENIETATARLRRFAVAHDLAAAALNIRVGPVADEILRFSREIGADLIIVGSHGRRGIGRLLGSNASAIVHQAACDVLTVRLDGE